MDSARLAELIGPVARLLLGQPNERLSSKKELRFGTHGSLAVDLEKGTWFDHEAQKGGGTLDLITRGKGLQGKECFDWLAENGFADDRPNGKHQASPLGTVVAHYDYVDEAGSLLFQVVRFEPKTFRQRRRGRPDDPPSKVRNGWVWSARDVRQVPYRLPELIEAIANDNIVFVVEGEKDVDSLVAIGAPATCNAGGVGKWSDALNEFFHDANVVVIQDNDPQARNKQTGELLFHDDGRPRFPGQDHAREVCRSLSEVAQRVRLLDLTKYWPEMPLKGDSTDWIKSGGTIEQLFDIIAELPDWSQDLPGPGALTILSKADFIKGFVPPDYLIDGMLQRRYIYALTGQTGHAKTAVALLIARLVSSTDLNAMLGTHRVEKGRVVYFVGENPDDVRMRVIGADAQRNDEPMRDNISFIPGVFDISQMFGALEADMRKNGEATLIIVDTSAAYFLGNEELSNTQMGGYARMLRRLTTLPGGPCVLVLCHPIKHVIEPAQLLPRGGGAYLAEMDGNLTLWRTGDEMVELYHNKMRGPGFQSLTFRLETIKTTKLQDRKGRLISTVQAVIISQKEEETQVTRSADDQDHVLAAMLKLPDGSLAIWAQEIGWVTEKGEPYKKKVERIISDLAKVKGKKLVEQNRSKKWELTEQGKMEARKAAVRFATARHLAAQQPLL